MADLRRTRKFVDSEVQASLLRKIASHWLLFILANAVTLVFWTRFVEDPFASWSDTFSNFVSHFAPMLIVSLALLPVFLLDAARLSHRFTGPIMRVRRTLAEIAAGKHPVAIHFRKNDFWKSLATDFNVAFALREKMQASPADSAESQQNPS